MWTMWKNKPFTQVRDKVVVGGGSVGGGGLYINSNILQENALLKMRCFITPQGNNIVSMVTHTVSMET